jgi:hypothetical protein
VTVEVEDPKSQQFCSLEDRGSRELNTRADRSAGMPQDSLTTKTLSFLSRFLHRNPGSTPGFFRSSGGHQVRVVGGQVVPAATFKGFERHVLLNDLHMAKKRVNP